jgi:hypothetical protein
MTDPPAPLRPAARLSIEAQPPDMPSFPCAEVGCWTTSTRQLALQLANGDRYLLPVCREHAARADAGQPKP